MPISPNAGKNPDFISFEWLCLYNCTEVGFLKR